jgi:hypothetical protein
VRKRNVAPRLPASEKDYFRERAGRANIPKAKQILKRAGRGKPVMTGDEK